MAKAIYADIGEGVWQLLQGSLGSHTIYKRSAGLLNFVQLRFYSPPESRLPDTFVNVWVGSLCSVVEISEMYLLIST